MRKLGLLAACLLATPASATGLKITLDGIAQGVIEVDLFEDVAPQAVAQITALAEAGFYDGVVFHRVIEGFMAQTGDGEFGNIADLDLRQAGTGDSDRPNLEAEFSETAFERGVIGMARLGDPACFRVRNCIERPEYLNSANAQFFIMFAAAPHLNGAYTAIGEVTSGMEVVDAIKIGRGQNGAVISDPDVMTSVEVTE
ncbi:MAG: peptidylprolyl isomerase [Pseudomonadota bacterium]